jgi:pantetheine-phosphate adenylyltransferase
MASDKRIALFPGSFDPFTIGHESIVKRALSMFDEIVIAVGANISKKGSCFPVESRLAMIDKVFEDEPRVSVRTYVGLTVDFCRESGANFLLRGLRTAADFEYERAIAQMNKAMAPDIESIFLLTAPEHTPINSTIVKDIIRHGGDASRFVSARIRLSDYLDEIEK